MQQISQETSALKDHNPDLEERSSKRNWKTPKVVQRGVRKTNGKPNHQVEAGQSGKGPAS